MPGHSPGIFGQICQESPATATISSNQVSASAKIENTHQCMMQDSRKPGSYDKSYAIDSRFFLVLFSARRLSGWRRRGRSAAPKPFTAPVLPRGVEQQRASRKYIQCLQADQDSLAIQCKEKPVSVVETLLLKSLTPLNPYAILAAKLG